MLRKAFLAALAATLLTPLAPAWAADAPPQVVARPHRAVFELVAPQPASWDALLKNLENLLAHYGDGGAQFEVVAHGPGIGLMLKTNAKLAARMEALARRGVVFAACANTMKNKGIAKTQLLPFVTVVPAGVAEVIEKQEAGWAYIKAGH